LIASFGDRDVEQLRAVVLGERLIGGGLDRREIVEAAARSVETRVESVQRAGRASELVIAGLLIEA